MVVNEKVCLPYLASKRVKIAYLNYRAKSLVSSGPRWKLHQVFNFIYLFCFMGIDFLGVE